MKGLSLRERFLRLLFPPRCLLCGKVISGEALFCEACGKKARKEPFSRVYSIPGSGAKGFSVIAPLRYADGYRKTIYRMKFRGQKSIAGPVGRLMAAAAAQYGVEGFHCAAWVPMTAEKQRKRGYNQSELLAVSMAKELGIPAVPLLEKTGETQIQHSLSKQQRAKNVKNRYKAAEKFSGEISGKNVLLVDDIVTTGATMKECAGVLYRAGAKTVLGICAADVRRETEE